MTEKHDAVKAGVADAWDFWLSQHDVSVPMTIENAVKAAITDWLDRNGEELFRKALREAIGSAKLLPPEPDDTASMNGDDHA
jgi:hypothetical protein